MSIDQDSALPIQEQSISQGAISQDSIVNEYFGFKKVYFLHTFKRLNKSTSLYTEAGYNGYAVFHLYSWLKFVGHILVINSRGNKRYRAEHSPPMTVALNLAFLSTSLFSVLWSWDCIPNLLQISLHFFVHYFNVTCNQLLPVTFCSKPSISNDHTYSLMSGAVLISDS